MHCLSYYGDGDIQILFVLGGFVGIMNISRFYVASVTILDRFVIRERWFIQADATRTNTLLPRRIGCYYVRRNCNVIKVEVLKFFEERILEERLFTHWICVASTEFNNALFTILDRRWTQCAHFRRTQRTWTLFELFIRKIGMRFLSVYRPFSC